MEISLPHVLILLLIAAVCGFLAQAIAGYSRGGLIVAIVLGFIGALFGRWIALEMKLPEPLSIEGFPIVWSIIGGTLFVAIIGVLSRRR